MKASDPFKFEQKWWSKNKPITLKTTGLGAVLGKYEAAKKACIEFAKKSNFKGQNSDPFDDCLKVLEKEVPAAAKKASDMCNKTLHKDCLAVLAKVKSAVATEAQSIETLRNEFNNKYDQVLSPMRQAAKDAVEDLTKAQSDAENWHKKAELANKSVGGLYKIFQNESQKKTLTEEKANNLASQVQEDLDEMKDAFEKLKSLYKIAETAVGTIKDGTGVLSKSDVDKQVKAMNAGKVLMGTVQQCRDRTQLLLANSEGFAKEIKKAATKQIVNESSYLKRITRLYAAVQEIHESARKINNTIIPWGDVVLNIRKAIAKHTREQSVWVQPDTLTVPPQKWKATAKRYADQAPALVTKTETLAKQAKTICDQTIAEIPATFMSKPEFKKVQEEINKKLTGISGYAEKNSQGAGALIRDADVIDKVEANLG